MDAREFVLPIFGVSRLARFERMGKDIGLHISDSFTSDERMRRLIKIRVYARKKHTMIVIEPAFLGWEILRMGRRREEGPEVSNVFRWCSPLLFWRCEVKRMQGTHEDVERLCRKEKRCRICHGHVLESLKEKLDDSGRSAVGKPLECNGTHLLDDLLGKRDMVRREVSAHVRQEDLT